MTIFDGELGLQFVTHLANHYTVPDLVRLAQVAADKGFEQIWINDNIRYRGQLITTQRIDLLVDGKLIVEVKSVDRLHPVHVAQAVGYLRATHLRIALVVNFNVSVLKQGIRRVVV